MIKLVRIIQNVSGYDCNLCSLRTWNETLCWWRFGECLSCDRCL